MATNHYSNAVDTALYSVAGSIPQGYVLPIPAQYSPSNPFWCIYPIPVQYRPTTIFTPIFGVPTSISSTTMTVI